MERPSGVQEIASQKVGFLSSFQWIAAAVGVISGGLICDPLCRRYGIRISCSHAANACGVTNTGGNMVGYANALLVPFDAAPTPG